MKCGFFGKIWLFGRAWLVQPSEGHDETDFLGIKYCSTYKKVPKNPHFILDIVFSNKQSTFAKCDLACIDKKSLKKCHQYDQQFKLLLLLQIAKQDTKKERKHLKEVKHHAESKSWTPKATKDVVRTHILYILKKCISGTCVSVSVSN